MSKVKVSHRAKKQKNIAELKGIRFYGGELAVCFGFVARRDVLFGKSCDEGLIVLLVLMPFLLTKCLLVDR
jgi:hypothetical protein